MLAHSTTITVAVTATASQIHTTRAIAALIEEAITHRHHTVSFTLRSVKFYHYAEAEFIAVDPTGHSEMEMQPLTSGTPGPDSSRDPNAILNDCRNVGRAIDDLESRLSELSRVQRSFVTGNGSTNKEIDAKSADIMTGYRGLADRVKRIRSQPDAGLPRNKPQVDALDRRTRKAINAYQQQESQFRKEVQDQQRRQYLIVKPDASESELRYVVSLRRPSGYFKAISIMRIIIADFPCREATEAGGDQQIFQQALLNADRRGQAQSTLRNVQQRHDAIQQIERTMIELQQLFQDLDAIVVQQEPMVENIESKAMETNQNLEAGNVHVGKAVDSARAARKKKWICLGIVLAIILVIVLIVVIYLAATGRLKSNKS